jgi:AbiV family abortive infection protein
LSFGGLLSFTVHCLYRGLVEPRAFTRLLQIEPQARVGLITEGLDHIAEHVETLREDVRRLDEEGRVRAATILSQTADEEAAKALILLDIFRSKADQTMMRTQLRRLTQHLPRCIYVEVSHGRPATFTEVREHVDRARRSHYLDGPMDADWIFSNELLAEREGCLYVDFVWDVEGNAGTWMTPARFDGMVGPTTDVLDLVGSLKRTGCLSRIGLDLIAEEWRDFQLRDETHWGEVRDTILRLLGRLHKAGLFLDTATQDDLDSVVERWGFPLAGLDLTEIRVSREELREEQQRVLDSWTY